MATEEGKVVNATQEWARVKADNTQIGMVLINTQYGLLALCGRGINGELTPLKYDDLLEAKAV